jgi:hypothetical protein
MSLGVKVFKNESLLLLLLVFLVTGCSDKAINAAFQEGKQEGYDKGYDEVWKMYTRVKIQPLLLLSSPKSMPKQMFTFIKII